MIQFMFQVPVCFGSSVDFDPPPRRVSLEHHLSRYGSNMLKNCLNNTFGNGRSLDFIYVYIYIYYSYIYIYIWLSIHICPNSTRLSHTHAFQNPLHAVVTKMLRAAPEKSVRCRWWLLGGVWPKRLLLSRILLSAHWWRKSFMLGWGWDLYLLQMSLGLVMSLAIATLKKIEKHSCHYFSGKLHFYLFGVTIKSYF